MQIYTIHSPNITAKPQFCLRLHILPKCLLLTSSLTLHFEFESMRSKSIYKFLIQLEFMNKMPFNRPNVFSENEWTFDGSSKPKKFDTISSQWKISSLRENWLLPTALSRKFSFVSDFVGFFILNNHSFSWAHLLCLWMVSEFKVTSF